MTNNEILNIKFEDFKQYINKAIQKWYYLNELQKIHDRTTNRHN